MFGEVAEGLDTLARINETYTDEKSRPYKNIRLYFSLCLPFSSIFDTIWYSVLFSLLTISYLQNQTHLYTGWSFWWSSTASWVDSRCFTWRKTERWSNGLSYTCSCPFCAFRIWNSVNDLINNGWSCRRYEH